jgi:hypothetical protein
MGVFVWILSLLLEVDLVAQHWRFFYDIFHLKYPMKTSTEASGRGTLDMNTHLASTDAKYKAWETHKIWIKPTAFRLIQY